MYSLPVMARRWRSAAGVTMTRVILQRAVGDEGAAAAQRLPERLVAAVEAVADVHHERARVVCSSGFQLQAPHLLLLEFTGMLHELQRNTHPSQ